MNFNSLNHLLLNDFGRNDLMLPAVTWQRGVPNHRDHPVVGLQYYRVQTRPMMDRFANHPRRQTQHNAGQVEAHHTIWREVTEFDRLISL